MDYYRGPATGRYSARNSASTSFNSHRHAKSAFNDNKITSVGPDTLQVRLGKEGEEVDSVSTINKNINTNLLLMTSVLKNDSN